MKPARIVASTLAIISAFWLFFVGIAYVAWLPAGWPNYRVGVPFFHVTLHLPYAGALGAAKARYRQVLVEDARAAAQAKQASATAVAQAQQVTVQVRSELQAKLSATRERTRTLIKEVPVYVSARADSRCIVPRGFVQLHDAAARGDLLAVLPGAASGPLDTDSGLGLSSVADTVVKNYGQAHDAISEVTAWREWYVKQKAIYEAQRAKAMSAIPQR